MVLSGRRPVVVVATSLRRHRDGVLRAADSAPAGSDHGRPRPHEVAQQTAKPQGGIREHSGETLKLQTRAERNQKSKKKKNIYHNPTEGL